MTETQKPSKVARLREWWSRIVPIRVRAIIFTITVVTILSMSFQIQTAQLNAARQEEACQNLIQVRDDLREVLLYMIDLNDFFPDNEAAKRYTVNRTEFLNSQYPALDEVAANCP